MPPDASWVLRSEALVIRPRTVCNGPFPQAPPFLRNCNMRTVFMETARADLAGWFRDDQYDPAREYARGMRGHI